MPNYKLKLEKIPQDRYRAVYTRDDGTLIAEGEGSTPELAASFATQFLNYELMRVVAAELAAHGGPLFFAVGAGKTEDST